MGKLSTFAIGDALRATGAGDFMNTTNRILGVIAAIIAVVNFYEVFEVFSFSLPWFLLLVWTIALISWVQDGWDHSIEIGWKGQLLFLGARVNVILDEGRVFVPKPFGLKKADCRQTVIGLDPLLKVITADDVQVDIDGSVFRRIVNLNKYFDVEESGMKEGLDDIWDETIRSRVAQLPLDEVLKQHIDLATGAQDAMKGHANDDWGIEISRVVVASIKPDPTVAADLALKEREKLQRVGQGVEKDFTIELANDYMKPRPQGLGLSPEAALEQANLITGKANPRDLKTWSLNPEALALAKEILGRR